MAYTPIENRLGIQPISTANVPIGGAVNLQIGQSPFFGKAHPLGTIVRAYDPLYGEGEFIYLQLVAGQVVGNAVTWNGYGAVSGDTGNEAQYQAALSAITAQQGRPLGIAMSAFPSGAPATAFGWFQVGGHAVILGAAAAFATATNAGKIYQDQATTGLLTSTLFANGIVVNARLITNSGTPSGNFAVAEINRPELFAST